MVFWVVVCFSVVVALAVVVVVVAVVVPLAVAVVAVVSDCLLVCGFEADAVAEVSKAISLSAPVPEVCAFAVVEVFFAVFAAVVVLADFEVVMLFAVVFAAAFVAAFFVTYAPLFSVAALPSCCVSISASAVPPSLSVTALLSSSVTNS